VQTQSVADQPATTSQKSDLEVKVDAVKDGIELTENLVQQAKENKRIKDSTFIANRSEDGCIKLVTGRTMMIKYWSCTNW
jgi:hypothetical protein